MIRAMVALDDARIQFVATVADACASTAVPTGGFATSRGPPSQTVRVMAVETALANKLAAWHERRLLRDLNDVCVLAVRLGARPDLEVWRRRLALVRSNLSALRTGQKVPLPEFGTQRLAAADASDERALDRELAPVLPEAELPGLLPRIRSAVVRVAETPSGQ